MKEHQVKSQAIRLLDVWAIGPLIILGASRLPRKDASLAWLLTAIGVGTVLYNGYNYYQVEQLTKK